MEIRNIAIIAHVDQGKITLTDATMRQTGAFEKEELVHLTKPKLVTSPFDKRIIFCKDIVV